MESEDRTRLETSLRRIEELASALDGLSDPVVREHTRELLETVLDLHGLAVARMLSLVTQTESGRPLMERFGQDEQVRAVLLLHGLHPQGLEARVRGALDNLQVSMGTRVLRVDILGVAERWAKLRIRASCLDEAAETALREKIEEALLDAAPDLDAIEMLFDEDFQRAPSEVAALIEQ